MADFAAREKVKADNPGAIAQSDVPFQIGSLIKNAETTEIRTILEEERSIIIEGLFSLLK